MLPFPKYAYSGIKWPIFLKNLTFICIYQKFFVPLHRLLYDGWLRQRKKAVTYCIFAFAIYWKLRNVRSFRDVPIISQQTSILYMGVTYRYMGTSHSLGVDKEALIFLLCFFPISADGSYREPSLSKRGKTCKATRAEL